MDGRADARASDPSRSDGIQEVEVLEASTFRLGPFEGGSCDIDAAWYGVLHDPDARMEVTERMRELWLESKDAGLTISAFRFNAAFGRDPALLRIKSLKVRYRLSVRSWDVSRGRYADGLGAVAMLPVVAAKALGNVLGAAVAATGLASAVLERQLRTDFDVADSAGLRLGFQSWLHVNGVHPHVRFDHVPDADAADVRLTPLLVANHVSYLDGFVLAAFLGQPRVLATCGTMETPLLGAFARQLGTIEVDRRSASSRREALAAIEAHVSEWRVGRRPLLVFPEGACSNGDGLRAFHRGAFGGAPVRPVVLCYDGRWHPANTNFRADAQGDLQPTNDAEWLFSFLGTLAHSLRVRVLPPYLPAPEERRDRELFAQNVRALMSEAYARLRAEA